jgi:hypothetical protein
LKQDIHFVPGITYLKPSHNASKIEKIPPTAAPITMPMDTPFVPVLVGVVSGLGILTYSEKLEFILAAKTKNQTWITKYLIVFNMLIASGI